MADRINNRITDSLFDDTTRHWGDLIADVVLERFPDKEVYTCAAGISPSGTVHFGNFRDVVTAYIVADALHRRGKKTRFIYSWDNYDRMRKVPANVPEAFKEHIGKPLDTIPDPTGESASYAKHWEAPFETAMKELKIDLEYRYEHDLYTSGLYKDAVIEAMQKREVIARILFSEMTEKAKEEKGITEEAYMANFYPIAVYSRFTGKDSTKIISYDGDAGVTYKCMETGKEDTIDLRKDFCVKLVWKADWPMRWRHEGVVFEPGGPDHAAEGSSYDSSSQIAKAVFSIEPPVFAAYQFVGIQGMGTKMSGSKGNAISPLDLLQIYEPYMLKWLYMRRTPNQAFQLSFDTEVYRLYDESDREIEKWKKGELPPYEERSIAVSLGDEEAYTNPIPFKQAVALGQILSWDADRVVAMTETLGTPYDERSIRTRLVKAKAWLFTYNKDEAISLLETNNTLYWNTMDDTAKAQIATLVAGLKEKPDMSIADIETFVYAIPKDESLSQKENAPLQRAFFKHVYMLLIGKDTGPRLSTFLSALPRDTVLSLLTF